MKALLILLIIGGNNGPTVTSVEFDSLNACNASKQQVASLTADAYQTLYVYSFTTCVLK